MANLNDYKIEWPMRGNRMHAFGPDDNPLCNNKTSQRSRDPGNAAERRIYLCKTCKSMLEQMAELAKRLG